MGKEGKLLFGAFGPSLSFSLSSVVVVRSSFRLLFDSISVLSLSAFLRKAFAFRVFTYLDKGIVYSSQTGRKF